MFLHTPPPPPPQPIPVTIWIHGTRPSSFLPSLRKEVKQQLDGVTQAPYGLHSAQQLAQSLKHYKITKTLSDANSNQFPFEHLYVFGWSGDLDITVRQAAAFDLYMQLIELKKGYLEQYQRIPQFTILTHSHGGNVALELAPLYKEEDALTIHRLILLACPVQKATTAYAAHKMFQQIYAIHSHIDMVQILDPQRLHPLKKAFQLLKDERSLNGFKDVYQQMINNPLFSERHFPLRRNLIHVDVSWAKNSIPWNDKDIDVFGPAGTLIKKITVPLRKHHRGVLHTEFEIPTFISRLPNLIDHIDRARGKWVATKHHPDLTLEI